jgi:hypothetical protein
MNRTRAFNMAERKPYQLVVTDDYDKIKEKCKADVPCCFDLDKRVMWARWDSPWCIPHEECHAIYGDPFHQNECKTPNMDWPGVYKEDTAQ